MSRTVWARVRLVGSTPILGVPDRRLDTGPFLDGICTVEGAARAAAIGRAALTTVCRGSLFCNLTLPGGQVVRARALAVTVGDADPLVLR